MCLCLCLHSGPGDGLEAAAPALRPPGETPAFSWVSTGTWVRTLSLACPGPSGVSPAGAQAVTLEPQPLRAPVYMCFHPLSLQGSDLPSKMRTSTFFFCILINTEEAGAVKLYLGENLRTGLFGVVEPLTAFNTRLVINCFVYLFSVFISTNKHCNYSY